MASCPSPRRPWGWLACLALGACAAGQGGRSMGEDDTGSSVGSSGGSDGGAVTTMVATLDEGSSGTLPTSLTNADDDDGGGPAVCGDGNLDVNEICDDGNTDDADGCNADCTPSGEILWEQTVGSGLAGVDEGFGVSVDAAGNFVVVGYVATAAGGNDGWVRRYSPMGGAYWTVMHAGPGAGNDNFTGVGLDADGSVYAVGYQSGADASNDGLVRKVDTFGADLWVSAFDAPSAAASTVVQNVAIDDAGNVIVVGYHDSTAAGQEIMLRKFGPDGTVAWTRSYGGAALGDDRGYGVAATVGGDIYVAGTEFVAAEAFNMWLGKYDVDGNLLWSRGTNGAASLDDYLIAVEVDDDDDAYVCGYQGTVNQPWQTFLRRYDSDGVIVWTDQYLGETMEGAHCSGLGRAPDGDLVMVGGEIEATVRAALVRRVSADGDVKWSRKYPGGAAGPDYGRDAFIDDAGVIYVTGALDVGTDARDLWVAQLSP
ncbi:MAG: hypothetical protein IPN32_12170 [Deltaproteobacteria bacterium]|nr:hypothetical protein [Deltaproteobacteria bacterium]